jgi:hypothetical protein
MESVKGEFKKRLYPFGISSLMNRRYLVNPGQSKIYGTRPLLQTPNSFIYFLRHVTFLGQRHTLFFAYQCETLDFASSPL